MSLTKKQKWRNDVADNVLGKKYVITRYLATIQFCCFCSTWIEHRRGDGGDDDTERLKNGKNKPRTPPPVAAFFCGGCFLHALLLPLEYAVSA